MWTVHKLDNFDIVKIGKYETSNIKAQSEGVNRILNPFTSAISIILDNIREE